jgi:hypothetical protein
MIRCSDTCECISQPALGFAVSYSSPTGQETILINPIINGVTEEIDEFLLRRFIILFAHFLK